MSTGLMTWGCSHRVSTKAALLDFRPAVWAQWGESPLWITIRDPDWKPSKAIMALAQGAGMRAHHDEDGTHMPIRLLTGVELDTVTRHALAQAVALADLLPAADFARSGAPPIPPVRAEALDVNHDES